LKILAAQDKIIEAPGNIMIKAASKEYYEGKIDDGTVKQLIFLF
jgi:hypothetical protein